MHAVSIRLRVLVAVLAAGAAVSQCSRSPAPADSSPMAPVLTVQELMEHVIDPQADTVFNAVAYDAGPQGVVETKPTSDEDWTRIERAAWVLAESSNLLKLSRRIAADHVTRPGGPGAPELSPAEIEAKAKTNLPLWHAHADAIRVEALKIVDIVKARDAQKLFDAGSALDHACENCHLDFWYPGDRAAVQKNRESTTFTVPPRK